MKKMTMTLAFIALAGCASKSTTTTTNTASTDPLERKVTVERHLINAQGEADGLLLTDGMQVAVPPRYSKELLAIAGPKDVILVSGPVENDRVIAADKIMNVRTGQALSNIEALPPVQSEQMARLDSAPREMSREDRVPSHHKKQKKLSAQGTVQNQLYDRSGEVNGVILSDGSIVRFTPRMVEDAAVKVDIGQNVRASGYGFKNSEGKSIEATTLKN